MPEAGYLTIGKVVKRLQSQYPGLSISKVRYLEDEGLLNPSRTPAGYRLYSQKDLHRLETILYLQKNRFLPLSVIKKQLDGGEGLSPELESSPAIGYRSVESEDEDADKLHPIDRMPEVANCSVSFVRQLAEVGLISLKRSPHGRDLVDGRDLSLIRICDQLQHFGIGPKNLRQYVTSVNRESLMFEQALMVYARKAGGVEVDPTEEHREQFEHAFSQMLLLTGQVREGLIRRQIGSTFSQMK